MKKAFLSILVAVLALPALAGMVGMTTQSAYADEARPQDWSQDGSNPQEDSGSVKEGTDDKSNAERAAAAAAAEDDDGSGSTDSDGIVYKCGNAGGADALGWILCPAMTLAGNATNYIYNAFVEPSLKIEPKLFTSDQGGVDKAWGTFRDIANVLFVILFLVVIISQLTGVGIDNYGIKKILPKLIVVAILINLSYILCIILIDISNIIGNSIQALFDGLGSQLSPAVTIDDAYDASGSPISGKSILATGGSLAAIGIIGVIVGMTGAVWATPGILLSAVLGILGIAVSIFFLFVLLAAREAAIVILVVLSPLAVACYMLPNTKKLFNRWVDIFKAMLLLYPICGLLVGGGNYVSSLLLTVGLGDGFFTAITSMLVGIVPIFFIPSLTKQAFAAMGALGGRIAGYGDRWRGRTQGVVANSQAYKRAQGAADRWRARNQAGVDVNGKEKELGRFGRFMRGGNRSIAMARSQHLSNQKELNAVNRLTSGEGFTAAMAGVKSEADDARIADAEAMLAYGNVPGVNVNDMNSLYQHHSASLARYHQAIEAGNQSEADDAMAQVKAAQNYMAKTDPGRGLLQQSFENAVTNGQTAGLSSAASHLMSEYGETLKTKNRGAWSMTADLASGQPMSEVAAKVGSGEYSVFGTDKYTAETLSGADKDAIARLVNNMDNMTDTQFTDIQATALDAIKKADGGTLNIKPEARKEIEKIAYHSRPTPTGGANSNGPRQTGSPDLTVPHGNTPTNIGGPGGADSVTE